jgi:transcription termination factor Rho
VSDIDSMLLPDLKKLATSLGVKSTGLRKAELANAIKATQSGQGNGARRTARAEATLPLESSAPAPEVAPLERARRERPAKKAEPEQSERRAPQAERSASQPEPQERTDAAASDDVASRLEALAAEGPRRGRNRNRAPESAEQRPSATPVEEPRQQPTSTATHTAQRSSDSYDDDSQGGRRNRRRRNRDRNNRRSGGTGGGRNAGLDKMEAEPTVTEDDVLTEVSGILDVLDNYAFVRTSGYLPGNNDAYVSLSMVRSWGLRKGDIVTGAMRAHREGERQKFNPLVRIDTINGADPAKAKGRPEFNKLTPLYPQERLRLETTQNNMTGRIIDLVAPIGKGQRGLIVSPPKAGKTMVMQSIANAIVANNPEVHLMVVLVDERPEEVTDFQRSVKGEVIASTFDRPADDHTTVAELAIERAKRLVELGHDVVILLDGITRLVPRLQPGGARLRPHPVRRRRLRGAVPAEEVLRRRPQRRERRLAHHLGHRPGRDRLQDGRGHLRGVQGHRQHGAAPAPRDGRQAHLPGDRRRRLRHAPRGAADDPRGARIMWKLRRVLSGWTTRPRWRCSSTDCARPKPTWSSCTSSAVPRRAATDPRAPRRRECPGGAPRLMQ